MKNLIQQWIQDRLGLLIDMSPELFAQTVRDGYLLSEVLKSYEVITEDQLNMIETSSFPDICLDNFRNHINGWLRQIDVTVKDEDLLEIVNSKGTAALNLFYEAYLELNSKSNVHFVTKQRLNEKLHTTSSRFTVTEVKKALLEGLPSPKCKHGSPIEKGYDVVHWQQDHLQMLKDKCREAREEYMEYIRRQTSLPSELPTPIPKPETVGSKVDVRSEVESVDLTYEQLIQEQKYARNMGTFVPDPQESKRILKKFRMKQRQHDENDIFKQELQRELLAAFWEKVDQNEEDTYNKNITEALLKQSLYEKQMLQKLGEVKLEKQTMLENQQILDDAISKQKDADFVERLLLKDKDLDEQEFTYYLEKERALELHRKIYEEKLRLKAERNYNMCMETFKEIVNVALKEVEYKKEFGEDPTRRVRDSWKKMFVAGVPFYDYVTPLEDIVKKFDEAPEYPEEIIHLEIDRQDRIDEKDFESYVNYEWPWELDNIEVDDDNMYEMQCGLNVLGNVVHNLLVVKYPYPPLPQKPDLPNITISVCIDGLTDVSCLPLLQKILDERQVLVVEMQDAINFCVNAYREEIKVEVEDEEEEDKSKKKGKGKKGKGKKEPKPKKKPKEKKGEKSKAKKPKGKGGKEPPIVIEKVDKTVQTPRVYPCEEIPLSPQAQLGKFAQEDLSAGEPLTDYLLVAMFVEYLKSKPEIKGTKVVRKYKVRIPTEY